MMGLKCQGETENNSTALDIFASVALLHFKLPCPPLSLFLAPSESEAFSLDLKQSFCERRYCAANFVREGSALRAGHSLAGRAIIRSLQIKDLLSLTTRKRRNREGKKGRWSIVKRRTDLSLYR